MGSAWGRGMARAICRIVTLIAPEGRQKMAVDSEKIHGLSRFFEGLWYEKSGLAAALVTGFVIVEGFLVTSGVIWWASPPADH